MQNHKMIPLADATTEELMTFATVVLALEIPEKGRNTKTKLTALIKQAYNGDMLTIPVPEGAEAVQAKPTPGPAPSGAKSEGDAPEHVQEMEKNPDDPNHPSNVMETIFIDSNEDPGGDQPVWISVNGQGIWVPRGKEVDLKYKFIHVLENAKRTVYEQIEENGPLVPRSVDAYPWRRIQKAA